MTDFVIVPATEAHLVWILDSFRRSLQDQWPWSMVRRQALLDDLHGHMALGRTVVAVAPDDPDSYLGWACVRPERNEVVFAFTKYGYRQKFRIGTSLIQQAGVDLTKATGVRYWTRASERISRRSGYRLYARVTEDDVEEAA